MAEIDEKTIIIRDILGVYRIYRPKYDLKDDDEKERIVAEIAKLDKELAEAFVKDEVDLECQLTD